MSRVGRKGNNPDGRPPALTPQQKEQIAGWARDGLTYDEAYAKAKGLKWNAGRTTIGDAMRTAKATQKATAAAAAKGRRVPVQERQPAPAEGPADLAAEVTELRELVTTLTARLDAFLQLPKVTLTEAAAGAVDVARRMSQDPTLDPSIRVKSLALLPDLIESARKATEAESGFSDDDLPDGDKED